MAFDEIIAKMQRGKKVGNTYFQSLLKNGSKNFPFAEFIYEPSNDRRVPTRQKDIYHLALLTLNLGAIKRQRFIGGNKRFPSWIRRDPSCVVLPHLIFRNGAHIIALCEASDDHGGIAKHQDLARDNAMLGMVVNAEITAPSLAIFLQGTHEVGSFIELLCQHQRETENKKQTNKFWILHGYIFRLAFGRVTSGEMVDPSSGIRTTLPTSITPNMEASVKPHPAPLATTQADEENNISEIDGRCDVESCLLLKPTTGADNHDVHRVGLAELRSASIAGFGNTRPLSSTQ